MIRIELKRVLKEGLIIILIAAALFIVILNTDKDVYIAPAMELFLLLFASFSGWSVFNREREEGALEYLLSLPVSRPKLLLIKFAPRIFLLAVVFIGYCCLGSIINLPTVLKAPDFAVFYFTFFLVSASFSISLRSFIGTFFLTAILSCGLTFFDNIFTRGTVSSETILRANLILLAFPVLFFFFFFKFDMKPVFRFNLRFIGYASLIIILMAGIRFLQIERGWCYHLMTEEGQVYRMSPRGIQFVDDGVKFRKGKCFWPLTEQGDLLYLQNHRAGMRDNKDIYTFHKKTLKMKRFHKTQQGWWTVFTRPLDTAPVVDGKIYFLQRNRNNRNYRVSVFTGNGVERYPLNINTPRHSRFYLFHVSDSPLRLYFRTDKGAAIFNAAGDKLEEFPAIAVSAWKNNLMIFRQGTVYLYRIGETIAPVFARKGRFRKVLRRFGSEVQRKVIYRNVRDSFVYDYETGSTVKMKVSRNLFHYRVFGDKFYLVYLTADGIGVDIYRGNKHIGHETWETSIRGYYRVLVFQKGIILSNRRAYKQYLFKN